MRFSGRRRFDNRGFGGRRFDSPRFDSPKPLKVGEEYDVEIKEVGSKGDGIARVNNFVVFVNGTKVGEKVRIKITSVMNRFAIGEKISGEAKKEEETKMNNDDEEEEGEEDSHSHEEEGNEDE